LKPRSGVAVEKIRLRTPLAWMPMRFRLTRSIRH